MAFLRAFSALLLVGILAACASLPDEQASYRFPRASLSLVVTQTLGCGLDATTGKPTLISAIDVAPTTSYTADPARGATFLYKPSSASLSDRDFAVSLTADGRLSGVNATNTGEGDTVLKDIASIASMAATGGILALKLAEGAPKPDTDPIVQTTCDAISSLTGTKPNAAKDDGKGTAGKLGKPKQPADPTAKPSVITLSYAANLLFNDGATDVQLDPNNVAGTADPACTTSPITFSPNADSSAYYDALPAALHCKLQVSVDNSSTASWQLDHPVWSGHPDWMAAADGQTPPDGYTVLKLNKVRMVTVVVKGPDPKFSSTLATIWRGTVPVPVVDYYPLLVPTGTTFGKQGFALALSDYGSVTKLEYSTTSTVPELLDVAGAITKALPTSATRAAEIQSESDLIYQQQRLVTCKLSAKNCPSK